MPGVRVDANVGGSDAGMNASSDPGSALLEVRGLSKSFGTLRALQEVDFTLRAGEIHALLGENGAGKSTLIKVVTGVFPRDAGIVRLGGAEVAPRSAKAAVDAGIATVYQEVNLLPNLSVAQNLYLGQAADAVRSGARGRDAPLRHRAACGVRSAYRRRRAARQLFGRGPAHRRDRARRRPVGAGADPRRADREPRSPRGRDPLRGHAQARAARHRRRLRHAFSRSGL